MRDIEVVKYRKLLYNIVYFCANAKLTLSNTLYPKRLTTFERGVIQGKHEAYNEVLKELHKAEWSAEFDWKNTHCREENTEKEL